MVGIVASFWDGLFSGAMLVLGSVLSGMIHQLGHLEETFFFCENGARFVRVKYDGTVEQSPVIMASLTPIWSGKA